MQNNNNNDSFDFNISTDDATTSIHLYSQNLERREFMGIKYYYYAYYFTASTPSSVRTNLIQELKFPQDHATASETKRFIAHSVARLDKAVSLPSYDAIILPQSQSNLARDISLEAYAYARPNGVYTFELVKDLPAQISFDYDSFTNLVLDGFANGKPRYTGCEKSELLHNISTLMDSIHQLDYFSIARNVKNMKFKPFIKNYLKFASAEQIRAYKAITKSNILIVDDISTSGTTLQQILKTIRTINDTNDITIFTLIGKHDF